MTQSSIGFPVTSDQRTQKMLQYVPEVTYGTLITTSPAYQDFSVARIYNAQWNNVMEAYRRMGSRNIYKKKLLRVENVWNAQWSPVDTAVIRYGTENGNTTASLAGTLDKSLQFTKSWMQNNAGTLTEHYQHRLGNKIDSITINCALGMVECSANWIARQIQKPVTTANGGLTTPTFATATTSDPWGHTDGAGASVPLVIDGVNYPCKAFSATVNNNMDGVDINGSKFIEALEPTIKGVTVTFEVVRGKDLNLEDDIDTFVADAASYLLFPAKTLTLTNLALTNLTDDFNAASTSAGTLVFAGTADDITVTA